MNLAFVTLEEANRQWVIKEKGLLPWKEHAFVYITDDYEYIAHNYLPYKTQSSGELLS